MWKYRLRNNGHFVKGDELEVMIYEYYIKYVTPI